MIPTVQYTAQQEHGATLAKKTEGKEKMYEIEGYSWWSLYTVGIYIYIYDPLQILYVFPTDKQMIVSLSF